MKTLGMRGRCVSRRSSGLSNKIFRFGSHGAFAHKEFGKETMKRIRLLFPVSRDILKNSYPVGLVLALFVSIGAKAATLDDDFNDGTIDTNLWSAWLPQVPNRGVAESGGFVRLHNGAAIITLASFPNATISGRFRISGWEYDRFKVIVRSDGTSVDTHWQERKGGIGIQFTSGSNPDYGPSQTLQIWDFQTGTRLATAGPAINMNTYNDYLISDSGTEIKVFLNDFVNPILTLSTNTSYGNKVEFANRTQLLDWPPPYYVDLDYISIAPMFCSPHRATATAVVTNGFVIGATIADGGCGYTNAPLVLIQGGGGSNATATAVISNGVVVGINFTSAGCCYTNAPRIEIASPPFVPTLSIRVSKVKVTQNVVLGRNYVLESTTNMVNWIAVGPPFIANSESITDEFDVDVTGRFFRIRQVP